MAVTARTLQLQAQINAALAKILDGQTRTLTAAWADAFDEIAPDLTAALLAEMTAGKRTSRAALMRSTKLASALAVTLDHLTTLAANAGVTITADLHTAAEQAATAQAVIAASQLPDGQELVALDAWGGKAADRALEAIVKRSTQQVTSLLRPVAPETYQVIRRELIRGMAAGSNPKQTAARMVRRTEKRFNFGLTRALVISRTETLDAHRAAAQQAQALHTEVLAGWSWLAKLDSRTCRSCWAQHGKVHPLSEAGPLDHQCGRCARVPVTKSWRELGFNVAEPPSAMPNAEHTFVALSADEQRQILGPAGYGEWAAGRWPMDAWSKRRTSDGWRDSFGPASPPIAASRYAAS